MDVLYLIERDHGNLGIEGMAYREWTRARVVDLCAFEFRQPGLRRGETDVVRVLEIREDEHSVSDITEEIMREAEALRAEYHKEAAE